MRKVHIVLDTGLKKTLVNMPIKQHSMAGITALPNGFSEEEDYCTSSECTDAERFSVHTSSSISLTAGGSENNRAAHNTIAEYYQSP